MKNIFYDKSKVDYGNLLFPRRALWMLLIPLIIEQMLNSLMGMVDTLMVSRVGAEAISAVSLVDSINNLVLQVFAAMAAGAAIICSQYLVSVTLNYNIRAFNVCRLEERELLSACLASCVLSNI